MRTIFALLAMISTTPEAVARLDGCIQRRFGDTKAFGIRRILPGGRYHGAGYFQPENAAEREVAVALREQGYDTALFLAGRAILTGGVDPRSRVQGPAFITPDHT